MTELVLDCGAASDTGLVREHNEDRYWVDAERGAFLVVDGVGGHAAGERAAEIAVTAIREAIAGDAAGPNEARARQAIAAANNRIYEETREHPELAGMACGADAGAGGGDAGDDRARGRFPAVPDWRGGDSQGDERPFAGGRVGGRGRPERRGGDGASAAE